MGIYAVFAVTGLVIVITTNVYLFQLIQILGICLLLYFGIQFILQKSNEIIIDEKQKNINSFIQGFSISILNPKILIWFAAIFSQFVSVNGTFTRYLLLEIRTQLVFPNIQLLHSSSCLLNDYSIYLHQFQLKP